MAPAELVARIAAGSVSAEHAFVVAYRPLVLGFLQAQGVDREAAQDTTQDTLIACLICLRKGRVHQPAALKALVLQIARNLWHSELRRLYRSPFERHETPGESADPAPGPFEFTGAIQTLSRVVLRLDGMARRDSRVLRALLFSGRSRDQIAVDEGMSPIQLTKVVSRARRRLRERMEVP